METDLALISTQIELFFVVILIELGECNQHIDWKQIESAATCPKWVVGGEDDWGVLG